MKATDPEPSSAKNPFKLPGDSWLPWIALALALLVVLIQAAFAYSTGRSLASGDQTAASVLLFISLIVSLIVVVVAVVALAQRRAATWASLIALGIGSNVLIVSIASWLGSLASTSP
ncbi:hypothetical protein BSZ39_02675 [Bowdeniella nasicola]|uniref:Uncharacterized protein n=1 Tax=Bowdeniella nasicola TaxID=208480 RepID=A0A1Q5Q4G2_9ACTO|nr:hypothetical protein [Bowdeniella nasicola]OKL54707.1 hypothetical protein BSZ39_02675 [Bowdeniella nasicola]